MRTNSVVSFFCACILFTALAHTLEAQIGGGSISGFVADTSKAVVPGAQVTATDLDSNVTTSTVTNGSGYYEFPILPAGRYVVETTKQGFRPSRSAEFALNTGTQPRIDLTLEVGSTSSTVEVTAQAPIVNATNTDLGEVVGTGKVDALPLNGRNWEQLVNLQPGANATPSNSVGTRGGMMFNGSPGYGNQLLLDGVDMSFGEISSAPTDQAAGAGTSLIGSVSVAAIQEIRVDSSSFSAEYGEAVGGVVNITTKSGTNQFHGELFEFFRNDKLDANDFFSNKNRLTKPPLRWNQFGGNIGGPIKKNKLFFFFNYEAARVHQNTQLSGDVATPLLLSQVTPAIAQSLKNLPSTYTPTSNPLLGFSVRNANTIDSENTTLSRLDYDFHNQRLTVRFSDNWSNYIIPQFNTQDFQLAPFHFYNAVVEHTASLNPTTVNEFRFGLNKNDLNRHNTTLGVLPGWVTVPTVGLTSDSTESQIHYFDNTYTIADNLTAIRGSHTFKAGLYILDLDSSRYQNTGLYQTYLNLSTLIADNPQTITVTFGGNKALDSWRYGFYGQDDWRITRRILLTYGLRYEYFTPFTGGFNITNSNPFGPFNQKGQPMFASNTHDFGPRAGLAWDPMGNQKLVLRAGAGISYVPAQPMLFYDFSFISPQIPFTAAMTASDLPPTISRAFPFPQASFVQEVTANPAILNTLGVALGRQVGDYHLPDGEAAQWNLSVQAALTSNTALQVSYVGNHVYHLWLPLSPNQFLPDNGPRPFPSFGAVQFVCACSASSYNALQVSLNQRNFHGLVLDAYYTLANNLSFGIANDTNNINNNAIQDLTNIRGSYGQVDGSYRNAFVLNHSYLLPTPGFATTSAFGKIALGGWSVDGIMTIRSGTPINVLAGLDLVRNQRPTPDRPDLVLGVNPYVRNMNTLQWLNVAAFNSATPYSQIRYGNLGYNALVGPAGFFYDAALHKQFSVTEWSKLTFRAEAFNILNHPVFNNPTASMTSPQFGQITSVQAPRAFQLALTYAF
jgi:Carboxypeptidase regulatory-like domain/TonB dependent receptor-like, beta-barrel